MCYDLIIVGGGAAGLMAAITLKRLSPEKKILLIDKNKRPGRKLLSTGNGRCNFTNDVMTPDCYRTSGDPAKIAAVLSTFTKEDTLAFFRTLGIYPKMRFGTGYYPATMQAEDVLSALLSELTYLNVTLLLSSAVTEVTCTDHRFTVATADGTAYQAKNVLLSTGGCAAPKNGSTGDGYRIAEAFGHTVIPPVPALTAVLCKDPYFPELHGIRLDGTVRLYRVKKAAASGKEEPKENRNDEELCYEERGELQLLKDGISGIPVFQISREIARSPEDYRITLDLFPALTEAELKQELRDRILENETRQKNAAELLTGLWTERLAYILLQQAGIPADAPLTNKDIMSLVAVSKHFPVHHTGTRGFADAQVTAGGIPLEELEIPAMQSKKQPGLYFAGELLDVDGHCGGYNLQWAWSGGYAAAVGILERLEE